MGHQQYRYTFMIYVTTLFSSYHDIVDSRIQKDEDNLSSKFKFKKLLFCLIVLMEIGRTRLILACYDVLVLGWQL